jgi:long-subunit acyl-CoA synthetase (AMP-forming)
VKTLYEALQRNLGRIPEHPVLGTKRGNKYEWMNVKEISETALGLASGCMALDLVPEVQAEGITYRFIGIQSKNRKEWYLQHIANFHMGVTTVAMYDTLGEDASRYVIG